MSQTRCKTVNTMDKADGKAEEQVMSEKIHLVEFFKVRVGGDLGAMVP